jgi:uncharacterized lipoprotein YajG
MVMATRKILCVAAALSLLSGCASNQVHQPKAELNAAAEAITRARQANAYEFASFDMTNADRKFDRAQRLSNSKKDKDRLEARRLAEQATLDARLAETKQRLAEEKMRREQMSISLDVLRSEDGQNQGGTR